MADRLGFVGMGVMGAPMARNLLRAGNTVTVWSRTAAKAEALRADGVEVAGSLPELAARCEVVFLCVTSSPDVEEVVAALLPSLAPGALVVDMSTIDPEAARRAAAACAGRGVGFLDAPVSGGETGAINGTLTIMVGGDAAHLERARPYLATMGNPDNIVHCGTVGSGEVVKLVNNLLGATIAAACGEALLMAAKAGADLSTIVRVAGVSSGANWQLASAFPSQVFSGRFKAGFFTDLMTKDVRLATELGQAVGVEMPVSGEVLAAFRRAQDAGHGRDDYTAVVRPMERQAGIELRVAR
jgi:3-hydroxyisobutyrate dehydrogenase-like beta-hydroxyacid dehydrogenase